MKRACFLPAGLVILALADILVFRFVFRVSAMETLGWIAFAFLQARPDLLHPLLKFRF